MVLFGLWDGLSQIADRIAQGDELLAVRQHDGIVEAAQPALCLRHVAVDAGGSISSPSPSPGRVIRAYQTCGHLPVAVRQAFVRWIRPTSGVDTSAPAVRGCVFTSEACYCLYW